MNNLIYGNQQAEKIGPQVEEKLRKETSAANPIPYQVEPGDTGQTTLNSVFKDIGTGLFGGKSNVLFTLVFEITTPRPAQLRTIVVRQGIGSYVQALFYSVKLAKPIKGEVVLAPPKTFGASSFVGDDAEAAGKLNAKGDISKRIGKFARTKTQMGAIEVELSRFVKLMPQADGTLVMISSLPRMTNLGMDASLDAKEFFEIAAMIEAAL